MAVLGARQVGKTTLAGEIAGSWPGPATIFDLEVATDREALSRTPARLLGQSEGLVVIDEVQRLPQLFEVLRPVCDDPGRRAVFLLLGSLHQVPGCAALRGRDGPFAGGDRPACTRAPVDARRLSPSLPGPFGGRLDALDAVILADVPCAGHRGAGIAPFAGCTRPLLENAGPLSRPDLERLGTGAFHGRGRPNREPLPRPPRGRVHDPRVVSLVREPRQATGESPKVYLRDSGLLHFLLGLEESDKLPVHPAYAASWEGFRPRADPDRAWRARRVLLRHAARGRAGPPAAAPRATVGVSSSSAPRLPARRSRCMSSWTISNSHISGWSIPATASFRSPTTSRHCL